MTINKLIINAGKSRQQTTIKTLIYGDSGAGKSFFAVTAPKPLVLLTEMNGQASIMHSNPDADIIHVTSAQLLAEILHDLDNNPKTYAKYETIVIDSLTEVQQQIMDSITKNGEKQMMLQDWGKLGSLMRRLIRRIRGLNKNVVCIALQKDSTDEETGKKYIFPSFKGSIAGEIAQYFNFVGYLFTQTNKDQNTIRRLMVEGPTKVLCKPTYPLNGVIDSPNLQGIFKQIKTQQTNKKQ